MSRRAASSRTDKGSAAARTALIYPPATAPTTRHLGLGAHFLVEQPPAADVDAVDEDVDQPSQLPGLIEEEVPHRELAERLAHGRGVELEALLTTRFRGEHRGQQDDGHYAAAASTDRIGGRSRATSVQRPPPRGAAHTEPLCVPK